MAIFIKQTSSFTNQETSPAGFFITHPNNTFEGNTVAASSHYGFWFKLDTYNFNVFISLGRFFNNTVHSVGAIGLFINPLYSPTLSGYYYSPTVAEFKFLTSYRNNKGVESTNSNSLQFRNFFVFENTEAGIETRLLYEHNSLNSRFSTNFYSETNGSLVADSIIIGNSDSDANYSLTRTGLVVAWDRGLLIKNVSFYNFADGQAIQPTTIPGGCT